MRRLLMLFVGFLASVFMFAESVDKTQALRKAQKFMPGKIFKEVKSVSKARGDASGDAFYVFNAEKNDGFVIVSGDDRTVPILGYSRTGSIDMDKIPENMKWWLDSYARQMEAICTGSLLPSAKLTTTSPKAAIPAMIQTSWGQGAPYNLMCPDENFLESGEQGYDPTKLCLTGCVATAMAQVMYYHGWPESCPAIDPYSVGGYDESGFYYEKGKIKAIPSTTFDWTKMKTSYNANETGEAAQEVAKLMRYCGQAMNVEYGVDGTGGYLSPSLLASVFNYSKNIRELSRDSYTTRQWEAFIYDELVAGRPVLYGGSTKKYAGHQFIVDGYDGSGLFHINWGWGGFKDSYFVLSIADPDNPGAGADSSEGAYQIGQSALIGVKPAEVGEVMLPSVTCYVNPDAVSIATYTRDDASMDFKDVVLTGQVFASYMMEPPSDMTIEYGWALYQDDNLIKVFDNNNGTVLTTQWWWNSFNNDKTISFGAGLTDGKYQLSQIYRLSGDTEWKRCGDYGANSFIAEVFAKSLNVRLADTGNSSFVVNNMSLVTELPEIYSPVELKLNVTNNGESRRLLLNLWAKKEGTENWVSLKSVLLYINPGETEDVLISYIPENAGTYTLKVTDNTSDEALKTATVSVVSNETIIIDNVKYLCTPAYNLAKVIGYDGEPEMLTSINIRQTVEAGGVECQVKEISDWALVSLWNVKSLVIPQGVERIGESAFRWMSNLTKLELPASLKSIGEYVTQDCQQLNAVISRINEPGQVAVNARAFSTVQWNNGVESLIPSSATLYVPIGTKAKYEAIQNWNQFAKIEEGELLEATVGVLKYSYSTGGTTATVIQDDSYKSLTSIVIPAKITVNGVDYNVTTIGDRAFYECYDLESVSISDGITFIGKNAFERASRAEITLPNSLKTIDNFAFWGVNNIAKTLALPEGLESIGEGAFAYCDFQRVVLPSTLMSIGGRAFIDDRNIVSVISKIESPMVIEQNTFAYSDWDAINEKSVFNPTSAILYVPVGTKAQYESTAGWDMFAGIEEGEPFEYSDGILKYFCSSGNKTATVIHDDSYKTLTSVVIPAKITVDGVDYNVTTIRNRAFYRCEELETVTISDGITVIGENAFEGAWRAEITLPGTLKTIDNFAFWGANSITNNLVLPEGLESIGEGAFAYCNIQKLVLPSTLKSIGGRAFLDDRSIVSVVSKIESPMVIEQSTFAYNVWDAINEKYVFSPTSAILYVPVGTKAQYESTAGWNMFASIEEGELMETTVGVLRYSYSTGGTTATVIQDESYQSFTEVTIPATINIDSKTYSVTAIGNNAFQYCYNLATVVLSEGLESIGNNAFQNISVSEITFPSTLKSIGASAFEDCRNIKTVVIPEGVETIGDRSFSYMGSLTMLVLPSSLRSLGSFVVIWDSQLVGVISHIDDPNQVTIDENSFVSYKWNASSEQYEAVPSSATLYVPVGTKTNYEAIPAWTQFAGIVEGELAEATVGVLKYSYSTGDKAATVIQDDSYKTLTSVVIPATITVNDVEYNVTAIGTRAFIDCNRLESVNISEGITVIGDYAFQWNYDAEFILPSSLKAIGDYAFWNANGFRTLVLPEGLESIGSGAFAYCYQLQTVELPSTLTSIGERAFIGNRNMVSVKSKLETPMPISESTFAASEQQHEDYSISFEPTTAILYVPEGKKDLYESTAGWNMFASIEEGELMEATVGVLKYSYTSGGTTATVIRDDSYQSFTEVNIPATIEIGSKTYTVKAIGNEAFRDCYMLESLVLPNGLETIGKNAFQNIGVSEITFPSTLKTIGAHAFEDCWNVQTVVVPEGVETIGEYAFSYMGCLTRIELPASLKNLGYSVVIQDPVLLEVISNITDPFLIESYVFGIYHWDEVTNTEFYTPSPYTLYVPAGTKSKYLAIPGWTMFASIEEGEPFDHEINFADLFTLKYRCSPDSRTATLIKGENYSALTQLKIPASIDVNGVNYRVKAIGGYALADCGQLTTVILPEGLVSIGCYAFSRSAVSTINFPSTLKTIYEHAFWDCDGLTEVKLPEGLESIGNRAFEHCSNLESLTIPSTVKDFGWGIINEDDKLTSVTSRIFNPFAVQKTTFLYADWWDGDNQENVYIPSPATLYVHPGKKDAYLNTEGWKEFQVIEEQVLLGDANGDGDVDNKDLDIIVRHIMGEEIENFIFKNADLNEDNKVDVGDVVKLIDKLKLVVN